VEVEYDPVVPADGPHLSNDVEETNSITVTGQKGSALTKPC
jgi:hypothetical protein